MQRKETRIQRYNSKLSTAKQFPVSVACYNFHIEENVAFVVRAAACFGAEEVLVIGSIPSRRFLRSRSGSLSDYMTIKQFRYIDEFTSYLKERNKQLVVAELTKQAIPLQEYSFKRNSCILVGNESFGVTEDLIKLGDIVYVPMPGYGYCLNTSQTANIFLWEYVKQYDIS